MGITTGNATLDAVVGNLLLCGMAFSAVSLLVISILAAWQVFRNLK